MYLVRNFQGNKAKSHRISAFEPSVKVKNLDSITSYLLDIYIIKGIILLNISCKAPELSVDLKGELCIIKENEVTEEQNRELCIKKEYYELLKYWKVRPEL